MRTDARIRLAVVAAALLAVGFVGLTISRGFSARPDAEREPAENEALYDPDWFTQRAFPFGTIPMDEYHAAVQQVMADELRRKQGNQIDAFPQWEFAGPDNIGGRISSMAVAPGGTTIYIGVASGGVFKSIDAGVTWTPIFDQFGYYSIGAVALDPSDPNTLYVGTGEAAPAIHTYDGNGIYKTTDGGASWVNLGTPLKRVAKIAVDPTNPNRVIAAGFGTIFASNGDHGIYKSENGGLSWDRTLYVDTHTYGSDVVFNPIHPDTVLCTMWGFQHAVETAIYRSIDSGNSWTRLGPADGLPAANDSTDHINLAYAPSNPNVVYANVMGGSLMNYQGRGIWRSTDGGATWDTRNSSSTFRTSFGTYSWAFQIIGVDPTNPDRIFVGGTRCIRSTNGGTNWAVTNTGLHADDHAIWIDPTNVNHMLMGCDGGFYTSANGGSNWSKGLNLPITQFYAITVDPADVNRRLGGTQDNNTIRTLTGGTSDWTQILGGDGFVPLVDHTVPSTVFAEWQYMCDGTGPQRSIDNGLTLLQPSGFVSTDRYAWKAPYVMDPQDHDLLLAGSHRVYKSTDNGQSYAVISADLSFGGNLTSLDISPLSRLTYYSGASTGKFFRSIDGGATWVNKSNGLSTRAITSVHADPYDSNTVYVTMSGFNGSREALVHVFKSTNRGDTWTRIAGDLPNMPVNDLVVDNLDPQRLYVATDLGVWTTQNGGASWYHLGEGMPWQSVYDLHLHTATRQLFAATYGRSMWKLDLGGMPTAVGPRGVTPKLALTPPTPNPSRGQATFALTLPAAAPARVAVYDAQGRLVRSLHDGPLEAGRHAFAWDGRDAAGRAMKSGVYFLRANAFGEARTQRIVRTS